MTINKETIDAAKLNGNPRAINFKITKVELRNGQSFTPEKSGVTLVVGPNNCGKSTLLREIHANSSNSENLRKQDNKIVKSLSFEKSGNKTDLLAWICERSTIQHHRYGSFLSKPDGAETLLDPILDNWTTSKTLGDLADLGFFFADAPTRFKFSSSAERRALLNDPPSHALHWLEDSTEKLTILQSATKSIFGIDLTLDSLARTVNLRIGKSDVEPPRVDNVTLEYKMSISSLALVDEQGDGFKSVIGQLAPLISGNYKVAIIDEPEAFLHPPQAYDYGAELGRMAADLDLQIIISSHNKSFVTGLLSSNCPMTIVRMQRERNSQTFFEFDNSNVAEIQNEPAIRYSNLLEGMFHKVVVLAEAERDCAYYAAALQHSRNIPDDLKPSDVLFVPTGGKDGMPSACQALSKLGVPSIVSVDLDLWANTNTVERIVEAKGHTLSKEMRTNLSRVHSALAGGSGKVEKESYLESLKALLSDLPAKVSASEIRKKSNLLLQQEDSPSKKLKLSGVGQFRGEQRQAALSLQQELLQFGIVVVEVGELESLAPEISARKGKEWLRKAFNDGCIENAASQGHIDSLLKAISILVGEASRPNEKALTKPSSSVPYP